MLKGSQIRKVRDALGLTIVEMAQVLHVHAVTLNRWELAKIPKVEGLPASLLPVLFDKLPAVPACVFTIDGERVRRSLAIGGALRALEILLHLAIVAPPTLNVLHPPTRTATGGTPTAATSPASKPRRSRAS